MKIEEITQPRPGDLCLICGAPPAIIGVFKPQEPETWGAAPGKARFLRYCLCSKCHGRPDTPEKAEKIIRAELAGGSVHHV
jgi:hypothetical protein